MTTDLDHAISSAISDLVAAAPEPLDTPSIATITGRPVSRRPRLLLATAASAAIIGGGLAVLAVARRHTSTDLTTATATDNTAAADGRGLDRLLYPAASSGDATAASISAPGSSCGRPDQPDGKRVHGERDGELLGITSGGSRTAHHRHHRRRCG